jgi:CDP-glucose 4,6-dehydratase
LRLDASRARARLGWRPLLDLYSSLAWIVDWHRGVAAGRDARALCEGQLAAYFKSSTSRSANA